jgi:hypothetical protein
MFIEFEPRKGVTDGSNLLPFGQMRKLPSPPGQFRLDDHGMIEISRHD